MKKLEKTVELTPKQAKFVACMAKGMIARDAYRQAYDVAPGTEDKCIAADAAQLKRRPNISLALREALRAARAQDIDSAGEIIADTKEAIQRASDAGQMAAVMSGLRLRGNWAGIEKQTITLRPENLLSDQDLVERLAGEDERRIAAAKVLLGTPDSFEDAEYEIVDDPQNAADTEPAE